MISRVRKTAKTARLTRLLQSSMYVLKIANENRNQASPFARSFFPVSVPPSFVVSARMTKIPNESQKPP